MKPSLTQNVSGIFALLVGLTLASTSARGSRPDGYTDNGLPYYYAYPDEGYADEGTADDQSIPPGEMPPDYSTAPGDDNNYSSDASNIDPYYDWSGSGWDYPYGGPGIPYGQPNIFSRPPRQGFVRHDGMRHNFPVHSPIVTPHHNVTGKSVVGGGKVNSGHMMVGGAVGMGGGGGGRASGGHR